MLKKLRSNITKVDIFFFSLYSFIVAVIFRDILMNMSTHLFSWLDYPLVVWINMQHIEKIFSLNFHNYFDTKAFYPNTLSLLFADTFLPQALIMLPFYAATKDMILSFNIMFLITFLLNYIAAYMFWKYILKQSFISFLATLMSVLGVFFVLQVGHFQMVTFWPFFFTLYYLMKAHAENSYKLAAISGLFLFIQFLASFYLSIFLGVTMVLYVTATLISERRKQSILILLISLAIFGIFALPLVRSYFKVRTMYAVEREVKPAHVTDYIFTHDQSLMYQNPLFDRWNGFDMHVNSERAAFPGFIVTAFALYGLFAMRKKKDKVIVEFNVSKESLFFLLMIFAGVYLSLSPRIFFNGEYAHIPTGYNILLNKLPFLQMIRSAARWSFLTYVGLAYFAALGMKRLLVSLPHKYKRKIWICGVLIMIGLVLESMPFTYTFTSEEFYSANHSTIKQFCDKDPDTVVLEYPVTHINASGGIIRGLNYISKMMLAQNYHGCYMVNGYSGVDLISLQALHSELSSALAQQDYTETQRILDAYNVDILKINTQYIIEDEGIESLDDLEGEVSATVILE